VAKVLLFGRLADQAGWRQRDVDASDLMTLLASLADADPGLGEALVATGVQVAVDKTIVRGEVVLTTGSEVAFLPPMSGG
jgi:molybdopterin synthase sulfur carrier subunit